MSKQCQKCHAEMADNMNFCPKCHAKFEAAPDIHSTQPAQQTVSPAEAAPKPSIARKFWSVLGSILSILAVSWGIFGHKLYDKHLMPVARAEKVKALCSELEHRPKDSIRVKHVGNDHYEVEFAFAQTTDENGRKEWIFLDEKAFTLVYNRETKKFSFLDWNEVKEWKKTRDALGWKK